jgi:hypothetical protein
MTSRELSIILSQERKDSDLLLQAKINKYFAPIALRRRTSHVLLVQLAFIIVDLGPTRLVSDCAYMFHQKRINSILIGRVRRA